MTHENSPLPSQDEWIARIYALAADPSRLLALRPALEQLADHGLVEKRGSLAFHFAEAEKMVREQPSVSLQADPAPITRLDRRLHVLQPGLLGDTIVGTSLPHDAWIATRETQDRRILRKVAQGDLDSAFVQLHASADAARATTFLVLGSSGGGGVDLHPISLRWDQQSGGEFATDFGLSRAETAVLRETLERGDLRSLAIERGTSLGTVRNQRKTLMAKLEVSSQNELIALYAGYRELRRLRPRPTITSERGDRFEVDGVDIDVAFIGPECGRPVLFFHPLFGGTQPHRTLERAFHAHHLRLIAPSRPYCGRDGDEGSGLAMVEQFVDRVARIARRMGLASLPVLGASGGTPYALAFAQRHPDLCGQVVIAGPTVPIASNDDLSSIGTGQRLPLQLARSLPTAMRLYVRAALAVLARRLDDHDYLKSFYRGSPADLEFVRNRTDFAFIRTSLERQFRAGTRCGVEELLLTAMDWSCLAENIVMPVHLFVGSDDRLAPSSILGAFAKRHGLTLHDPVEDAGSFLLYQRPGVVVGKLTEAAQKR